MALCLVFPGLGTDGTKYSVEAFTPGDRYLGSNGTPDDGLVLKVGGRRLQWSRYGEYRFTDSDVRVQALADVGL